MPNAVLMAPATSDAIAIPTPTVSPALSTIVFSVILRPLSLYVHAQLRIVVAYRRTRTNPLIPSQIVGFYVSSRRTVSAANAFHFSSVLFRVAPEKPCCGCASIYASTLASDLVKDEAYVYDSYSTA